ncbi:hypothetical protein B7463_g2967, partial [Scytalidium lignicola]
MGFLGVYKAIYDYSPNGEGELEIKEGNILYVLEKSGDDGWWKAKKKAAGDDDDEPVGLIPNNYIEEAQPMHKARALYDYTRQTDEELSFKEDSQLEVFDSSDPDWILVGLDGEYGFAPANYIEVQERSATPAAAPAPSAPPSLPQRRVEVEEEEEPEPAESPSSPVQTPAAAIAGIMRQRNASISSNRAPPTPTRPTVHYTPEASDEDEPKPALPSRSRSTSSPRVASPTYSSSFSNVRDDEAPPRAQGGFHMYNISEMISVLGKKKKMPTTLGINTATGVILVAPEKARDGPELTWTAEKMTHYSIEGKHIFLEFVRPSKSYDFHAGAKDTAEEIVGALGELAGAVRAEGLREIVAAGTGQTQKKGQMLYDFMAQGEDEVTVAVGDEVIILDDSKSEEWWQVRRLKNGKQGVVPSSYVEITGTVPVSNSGINVGRSTVEQNRLEEERLAKESLKAVRRGEDSRGSEVGPGMRLPERGSSLSARDNGNHTPQQRNNRDNGRDNGSTRNAKSKPDPTKVRTWTDRSKSFSVEAQFLALKDGKINLHKMNGVKIAVPVSKMSMGDLEYVERLTGISLDEDKPLSEIKKSRSPSRAPSSESRPSGGAGATIQKKPDYDWFQFFLSCDVAVGLCDRYAQAFAKDSMDESVLPDVDTSVLRTLGLREGDIIKVMRFLDNKYGRTKNKRNVSFGGEEVISGDGESAGGLFSGPGGSLKNNTRKGRPAPAVQTSDIVDPKAFSQESNATSPKAAADDRVATPLASVPPPAKKETGGGFDDDAWDVKPSKQPEPAPAPAASQPTQRARAPSAPQQPALTGAMQELSLLSPPLEPARTQPPPAPQQPQITLPPPQPQQQQPQVPQPTGASPAFFAGVNQQQTGFQPQPNVGLNPQLNLPQQQQNIARPRPPPGQFPQSTNSLLLPQPPARPLSAPQVAQPSSFAPLPLAPQMTGFQSSTGFQPQIAPPGQSLNDINQARLQQQYATQQQQQQLNFQSGFPGPQNTGLAPQPTGFNQFTPAFQQFQPQPTGFQQQQNTFQNGSPFADPRTTQLSPPVQPQPTGFQSSFPQQQFPQPTGVNSFLPPALMPQPTGINQQQQPGLNGFNQNQSFQRPPLPPIPQQQQPAPLVPQKTGPPPPVRFGVSADAKKLAPQPTGRRANLAQATPQNPFGF